MRKKGPKDIVPLPLVSEKAAVSMALVKAGIKQFLVLVLAEKEMP